MKSKSVTCSFVLDKDIYNAFKSVVNRNGENIEENIVRYVKNVILHDTSNPDTILAIQEVQDLKKNPNKRVYNSFREILDELVEEEQ